MLGFPARPSQPGEFGITVLNPTIGMAESPIKSARAVGTAISDRRMAIEEFVGYLRVIRNMIFAGSETRACRKRGYGLQEMQSTNRRDPARRCKRLGAELFLATEGGQEWQH